MAQQRYAIAGFQVLSEIALPALAAEFSSPDLSIVRESGPVPEIRDPIVIGPNWTIGPDAWRLWDGENLHLVQRGNDLSVWCGSETVTPDQLPWITGAGFAAALLRKGEILIHAAAVGFDSGAILVAGDSGRGKSTTAIALVDSGGTLLADDVVRPVCSADGATMQPVFLKLRASGEAARFFALAGDAASGGKCAVSLRRAERNEPVPIRAVCILRERSESAGDVLRLSKTEAFVEIIRHLFARTSVPLFGRSETAGAMVKNLVERVPVFALRPPQGFAALKIFSARIREACLA